MNSAQRRKLTAGVGLLSMLLGALMVLVPSGAGADHTSPAPSGVVRGNAVCPDGTATFKFDSPFDVTGDSDTRDVLLPGDTATTEVTISYTGSLVGDVRHYAWTSTSSVVRVIVKQGPDSAIFDYAPGTMSGTAYVALLPGTSASPAGTSHLSFCLGGSTPPPPQTGSLSVDKIVTGDAKPTTDPAYAFTVSCTLNTVAVELDPGEAAFTLTEGAAPKVISGLPVGTQCTVTETNAQGASSTSITVDGGTPTNAATVSGVTIGDDTTRDVDVTNVFNPQIPPPPPPPPPPPAPASLTVVKAVTGDVPDAWTFTFGIEGADIDDLFELDQTDDDEVFELAAGAYEVTEFEVADDGALLTDVECLDADDDLTGVVADGVVSLTLAAGADVTCTFTNDFAEVEPSEVTAPTTTTTVAPTTTTTAATVLGAQVTRLPTTGSGSRNLAGFGVALLGLGAALVVAGNRRVLKRS